MTTSALVPMNAADRQIIRSILTDGPATFAYIERQLHGPRPKVLDRRHEDMCTAITIELMRVLPAMVAGGEIEQFVEGDIVCFRSTP